MQPAAKLTVVEFFSAHCPCQAAHDGRLRELARAYAARGVRFVAVDSEHGATSARDGAEASRRGYPYPIVLDPGGALARELGAEYATYSVVLDAGGRVLYAGGLDSDRSHLTEGAESYVQNALDDALAGRPVRRPEGKTLGCALTVR